MKKQYQDATSLPLHQLFIVTVALTILSAFILAFLYSKTAHAPCLDPSFLIPRARVGLMPKPQEQFVFLILAFIVPIVSFLMALLVFKQRLRVPARPYRAYDKITIGIFIFVTVVLLYFPLVGYEFSVKFLVGAKSSSWYSVLKLYMTLLIATGWYLWRFSCNHYSWRPKNRRSATCLRDPAILLHTQYDCTETVRSGSREQVAGRRSLDGQQTLRIRRYSMIVGWVILSSLVMLQIAAWRISGELGITQEGRWGSHADAVLYAVSQVLAGKTLLVDLPSQYGLYPELLKPLFKLTGFSILNFTLFCALLQMLSLASIYSVVSRSVRDPVIRIAFAIALIMVTFETVLWLIKLNDPYYQYWPIRFFWPAMAILSVYRYSNRPTPWRALQVSITGAVGTLWNMDSGVMIMVAFAGVLIAKWVVLWMVDRMAYKPQRRALLNAMLVHIATFIIISSAMLSYLYLKGGGPFHWEWLFGYQKVFYGLGFMMMPMPLSPYPWMSILGIYLLALLVAARSWAFNPQAKQAALLTFVSLLGLGLFIYYEGRSHPWNLITVCWPAILLTALLADRVLRAVRTGLLSRKHLMLPIVALSVLLFCSIPMVFSVPKLVKQVKTAFVSRNTPADELVQDELRFIRVQTKPGDECVILSRRQGLYYAATGMASPVSGPGYIETILQRDRDDFLNNLIKRHPRCVFVGVAHPLQIAEYWYSIVSKLVNGFNVKLHQHVDLQAWIEAGKGSSSAMDLGVEPLNLLQGYEVVAHSARGSMLYLKLK